MFKITKDLSPEKVTGYTYQGAPIVLSKKRGRPPRTRAKPTWYPLDKKIHSACVYAVTGNLKKASELSDIPVATLKVYMNEQWWEDAIKEVRREETDQISAKMSGIIDKSLDAMADRLENGDPYIIFENLYDPETKKRTTVHKIIKVPVKMKDLTMPVTYLTDKRQLLRGEATHRSENIGQEKILEQLGKKFEDFAKQLNIKEPELIDVTDVEVIHETSEENMKGVGTA